MGFHLGALHDVTSGRVWDPQAIWSEIAARAHRNGAANVHRGDRVLLLTDNTLEFIAELLAVWLIGATAIPVDAALSIFELDNLAAAADPRLIIATGKGNTPQRSTAPIIGSEERATGESSLKASLHLDDEALILFTSGSTGHPKGVVHTHRSLAARWHSLRQVLGVARYQRTLCLLPVYFGHGLICNCLFPLLSGCDLHLGPAFTPSVLSQTGQYIDQHRITAMSSVPSLWRLALRLAKPPEQGT